MKIARLLPVLALLPILTAEGGQALATPARAPAATSPLPDRALARRLDQYVRSFADQGLFSGVVLVRRNGRAIYERAYGVAERRFGTPLSTGTRFMIASVSKPITAAAVARLVDQHLISFDDPISRYIAGIPNGDRITIEQLLTHHSGLDSPDRQPGSESWMRLPSTTAQLVERVRALPPAYQPGERYFYANANYWILAHLIERVSGISYGEFLRREIFLPLGMNDTGHRGDLLRIVPRLADGYAPDGLSDYRLADLVDWTSKTGNGSLYSTVEDLARFYDALVQNRLLSPQVTRRVLGEGRSIGFGWFHHDNADPRRRSLWFNGRSPGYTAYIEAYPQAGMSFIILSNLYVYSPTVMADGFQRILWNEPYRLQEPIRAVRVTAEALHRLEGTYQFGSTFFVRNGRAEIVSRGDHLIMRWSTGGLVSTLIPLGNDIFFDPTFWATLRFGTGEGGGSISYRTYGFDQDFVASRVTAS